MWSYQDLWIIKAHFVASCLSVLPNAGINSSTIRAAFSKENKRSWKSSWASSVQKTTHKGTGKDEAGRFLWLNQLVTSTSWKHSIVGEFFVLPFSFKSPVSLVRRKYHPGVRIWEAENGFYSYWESQTMPVLTNWKKKKKKWGSWYMCKAPCEWHTANKTNSLSEQQRISQKPLAFEQESLNELRNCASHITFVCEWIIVLVQKVKKRSFKKTYSGLTIKFPCKSCNKFFFIYFYLSNWPVLFPPVLVSIYFLCQAKNLQFEGCFNVRPECVNICITVAFREVLVSHKLHSFLTRYENLDWISVPLKILPLRHPTLQIAQQTFIFINSPTEVNAATKGCSV